MKIVYRLILLFTLILILFASNSCDAPRNNPVDPKNPDNKLADLEGTVKTKGFPFLPIDSVNVFWDVDNILVQTDVSGVFKINNIQQHDGWLRFKKQGFSTDSAFVKWEGNNKISVNQFLNSEPQLDSLEFYSVVEHRFQVNQVYRLIVKARIFDFEGSNDIDSVFIVNNELNVRETLTFDNSTNFYVKTLSLNDLNVSFLDEVIGKEFEIIVYDLAGRQFIIAVSNIKRVINEEIELISPINNELSQIPFTLRWKRFTVGYSFHYAVEINTNEVQPESVYRAEVIPSDSISHVVTHVLPNGNYFWVIWAIDEFNNKSRSKPGTFQISN